jgi:hypothetical protein
LEALEATAPQAAEIRRLHEAMVAEKRRRGEHGAAEGNWPTEELLRLDADFAEQALRMVRGQSR